MRLIFYVGKGGAGKTAVALATAVRSAELGCKTLIISTDAAHNLADFLDEAVTSQATPIAPNLWAQEINAIAEIQNSWGITPQALSQTISAKPFGNVVAEEVAAFPGMDDIASLMNLIRAAKTNTFERIIVDTAATGNTIRLLSLPDSFRWYADYLQRLANNRLLKVARPIAGLFIKKPAQIQAAFARMEAEVAELRLLLHDPEMSSYRVVLQPDRVTVREGERLISFLSLYDYPIDSVVMNRVLTAAEEDVPCQTAESRRQATFLERFQARPQPFKLWFMPEFKDELAGVPAFARLATACFGTADPGAIFSRGPRQKIVAAPEGNYLLHIPMPYMTAGDVQLRQRGNELFITMGNFKREMILAAPLAQRTATRAQRTEGLLTIVFEPKKGMSPSQSQANDESSSPA
jgi:arsenite-transporting ATPase